MKSCDSINRNSRAPIHEDEDWTLAAWHERQFHTSEYASINPTEHTQVWLGDNSPLDLLECRNLLDALQYMTQVPPYKVTRFMYHSGDCWTTFYRVRGPVNDLTIRYQDLKKLAEKIGELEQKFSESNESTEIGPFPQEAKMIAVGG